MASKFHQLLLLVCVHVCVCTHVQCLTLCDPLDCSPPGFSVHGILQARILEGVAISSSGDLPDPGMEPGSPVLAGGFFTTEPPGKCLLLSLEVLLILVESPG